MIHLFKTNRYSEICSNNIGIYSEISKADELALIKIEDSNSCEIIEEKQSHKEYFCQVLEGCFYLAKFYDGKKIDLETEKRFQVDKLSLPIPEQFKFIFDQKTCSFIKRHDSVIFITQFNKQSLSQYIEESLRDLLEEGYSSAFFLSRIKLVLKELEKIKLNLGAKSLNLKHIFRDHTDNSPFHYYDVNSSYNLGYMGGGLTQEDITNFISFALEKIKFQIKF